MRARRAPSAVGAARAAAAEERARAGPADVRALRPELERGVRHTDVGNGERFAMQHAQDVRFDHARATWMLWDGRRWAADAGGRVVALAKETVRAMYATAAALPDVDRQRLARHAMQSERDTRLRAMLALAQSEPEITAQTAIFDTDPWLLNVQNGTVDLRTGTLRPHRREDLITRLAPVDYDPSARCPRFEQFLLQVLGEAADATRALDLALFLQRAVGYSLTGLGIEHVLLFLHGTGRNGKSTFLELLAELLGDYARATDVSTILEARDVKSGPRPELLALRGARFVSAVEAGGGRRLNEGLVKQLTGGDRIAVRALHSNALEEFRPTFTLWLAANHKPEVRGTDVGIWSRIALVPFTVVIPPEERDPMLPAKLRTELPGIVRWAVEGCRMWQAMNGLCPPAAVREATETYRTEMDVLGAFLDDCCEIGPRCSVSAADLYTAYTRWSEGNGEHPLTQTKFGRELTARGLEATRPSGNRAPKLRRGLRLRGTEAR